MLVVLAAGLVLLVLTATIVVASVGTRDPVSFLLGAYAVAWAEVVGLGLALSVFHAYGRTELLIGSLIAFAAAAFAWTAVGRPAPPSFRPPLRELRHELADPALGILAAALALVLAYVAILGLATPQNEWDSLTYHLTRAAFWIQQGTIGYVPLASDVRINGNPPNAEIGQAWTMLLGGTDRFVWLPSWSAVPALLLGVFGIARRAALDASASLFGALVFACLPLVLLQASTAMNDLVVGSFFVVATYFAIGTSRKGALGACLSLGLAFGTKISAPLLLPVYIIVVVVSRRRRLVEQCAIVIAGISIGSVWYILNLWHTGELDGGLAEAAEQTAGHRPTLIATRAYQLLQDTIELPGASPTANVALFAVGAAVLISTAIIAQLRGWRVDGRSFLAAGAIVGLTPVLLVAAGTGLGWSWRLGWSALAGHEPGRVLTDFRLPVAADSAQAWYGPLGAFLLVGGVLLALRTTGSRRPLLVALALAPLLLLVVLAVALIWDPWRGRFFVFPFALASAAWGLAYRFRALAWAAVGLTVVTMVLVLVNSHTKPTGLRLVAPAKAASVFGKPRWRVQTWIREDGTAAVVRYVEHHVPPDARVGLSLRQDDFIYPYFGENLRRKLRFVAVGGAVPADIDWIIEAPGHGVARCEGAWQTVLETTKGFHVLRRATTDRC